MVAKQRSREVGPRERERKMRRITHTVLLGLVAPFLFSADLALADNISDFYTGRTITIDISSSPGGGWDALGRGVARHIGKHIPGIPTVVPRNVSGAGGLVAANNLYRTAPRDGTMIGLLRNFSVLEPLLGTKEATFEPDKLIWLGSPSIETGLMFAWHETPFHTIQDAMRQEIKLGADGIQSASAFYGLLMNGLLGTKIKIIAGFPGQNEAFLAIERGEIDGFGVSYWSSLTSSKPDWLKDGKVRLLLQYAEPTESALAHVPAAPDLVHSEDDRTLLRAANVPLDLGRPFALPPDVPAERVRALRDAFMRTMADPEFRSEAERQGLLINNPVPGERLQQKVDNLYKTRPDILDRLKSLVRRN